MSVHEFTHTTIDGKSKSLSDYAGQTLLIVNVASQCGLTPQYEGLENLWQRYRERGFTVLGFPCNQFGSQEPGTEGQIKTFCETHYGVSFPMFAKLDVNGAEAHPLYAWLTAQASAPEGSGRVAWNFGKFVIGPDGQVVGRFAPTVAPEAPELVAVLERTLAGATV
jgi:glutathione peroxidase